MTDTILSVKDINVYYGSIHAIKGISFDVRQGEIVTLIGANGAGKSTTLNTISGLLRSRTGSITFCGEPIGKIPAYRLVSRGLAQVPEGRHVFLHMTVRENLELGAFTRYRHGTAARNKDLDAVTVCSRGWASAAARWPAPFRAASSRCSPWGAR